MNPRRSETDVFCAIEFKYLQAKKFAAGRRWFTVTDALLPQILQSMIGHDAHVGLALTEQGYRVFLVEKEAENDKYKLYTWPSNNHAFHNPFANEEGLKILTNIVRIATRHRQAVPRNRPVEQIVVLDDTPCDGRPVDSPGDHEPPSPADNQTVTPVVKKSISKKKDKLFRIETVSGDVVELKSLSIEARFTEEELRKIAKLEKDIDDPFASSMQP